MQLTLTSGVLVLLVEADSPATAGNEHCALSGLPAGTNELLAILHQHEVEAGWHVPASVSPAAARDLVKQRQEIVLDIRGSASEHAAHHKRGVATAEQLARLTGEGVPVLSVASDSAPRGRTLETLARQGVCAVVVERPSYTLGPRSPRPLGHGCWELPIAARLPEKSGLFAAAIRRLMREIDSIAAARGCCQLVVPAALLEAGAERGRRVLRGVLKHVDQRRRLGILDVASPAGLVALAKGQRRPQPLRSILRPAA